jgi:hypothetical protein
LHEIFGETDDLNVFEVKHRTGIDDENIFLPAPFDIDLG